MNTIKTTFFVNQLNDFRHFTKTFLLEKPINLVMFLIVNVACFGQRLLTITYNNDHICHIYSKFLPNMEQQRWSQLFGLDMLYITDREIPFFTTLLGMLVFPFGIVCLAYVWKFWSDRKISHFSLLGFCLVFMSFPLNMEILIYPMNILRNGFSQIWLSVCLLLASMYVKGYCRSWLVLFISSFCLGRLIAGYEINIFSYCILCCAFVLYDLKQNDYQSFVQLFRRYWPFLAVCIGGIVIWQVGIWVCSFFFEYAANYGGAAKDLGWNLHESLIKQLVRVILVLCYTHGYNSFFNFGLLSQNLSIIIAFIFAIRGKNKLQSSCIVILMIFMMFALSFIQCSPLNYRHCMPIAFFVASIWTIWLGNRTPVKWITWMLFAMVILFQVKEINLMLAYDRTKSEQYKQRFETLGCDITKFISKHDITNKKVVVVGKHRSDLNSKHSICFLCFQNLPQIEDLPFWGSVGMHHFSGYDKHLYLILQQIYNVNCTILEKDEMQSLAKKTYEEKQPVWPCDGCIKEYDDFVVVNLGVEKSDFSPKSTGERQRLFINAWKNKLGIVNDN